MNELYHSTRGRTRKNKLVIITKNSKDDLLEVHKGVYKWRLVYYNEKRKRGDSVKNTTLCYIRKDGCYLMLHRVKKENDLNHDKWIGVGGKFLPDESPEECLLRETQEETGLTLTQFDLRGIVTFVSARWETEYMYLYTADGFEGEIASCDEGVLEWVPISHVPELELWEGDRIFLALLERETPCFTLKRVYDKEDRLESALLNGKKIR